MLIGAIILAAGEARRFGRNKLIEKVGDKTIIERVLDAVKDLDRIVIVGKYYKDLMPYLENEVVVYNPNWNEGLSSSLKLGLRFFSDYDGVLVLLGDMPLISSETIKRIISAFKEGCSAVVPTYKGQRGNPVLISRKLFEKLKNLKGDIGARAILVEERNVCEVECGKEVIIDVDTPSDLASVRRLL